MGSGRARPDEQPAAGGPARRYAAGARGTGRGVSRAQQLRYLLRGAGEVVPSSGEGVVAHGVQTDVHEVGVQAVFQVGGNVAGLLRVTAHFGSDIYGFLLRVPAPPVDEPGRVVEVVAVERVVVLHSWIEHNPTEDDDGGQPDLPSGGHAELSGGGQLDYLV